MTLQDKHWQLSMIVRSCSDFSVKHFSHARTLAFTLLCSRFSPSEQSRGDMVIAGAVGARAPSVHMRWQLEDT
jgi:hypothetical protein